MDPTRRLPSRCDYAVVGGGIVGLATAREIVGRVPGADVLLFESEDRLAAHQTSHTSGVIHAGLYYEPGSLRARLCVEGAELLNDYCERREIPHRTTGKLVIATNESELGRLDRLEQRGRANGVRGLNRIPGERIAEIEPAARGLSALHSPYTGVVDFARVADSLAAEFEAAGGTIHLSTPAIPATRGGSDANAGRDATEARLDTPDGRVRATRAVFCAGLQSDRLARAAGGSRSPRIVPIRGTYLKVRKGREGLVVGNIYPVPDPELPFLGAHLTRTVDGSLLIGPTALLVAARDAYRLSKARLRDLAETVGWPGTWRMVSRHWRATGRELRNSVSARALVADAARMLPGLDASDVEPGPSGVRAQALGRDGRLIDDFLVEQIGAGIHVRNAPSPAATSSLALARLIADRALAA